ncbi:MAG: hypothetical protein L6R40_000522 [Gallowayella cf. fulva]|nr:MAG: hypothetical protein L6R40_000522 [Xanthomendoza cf. fulva]
MARFDGHRRIETIPTNRGDALQWLLILANYTEIPMYQIIRILQKHFGHPYDPVKTRELYEGMEERMDRQLCEVIEMGVDDERVRYTLDQAAGERALILDEEQGKRRGPLMR